MKNGDLVLGGLSLAGGFVGASLLKPLISHHAGCGDCAHLSCSEVLTAACDQKCNQNGGLNAFIQKCKGNKILTTAPGNKISPADAAANRSQPALDLNPADNLLGGPNQQIINTLTGAGCGGIFSQVPVLGTVPCWAIILGAVGLIFLGPAVARSVHL